MAPTTVRMVLVEGEDADGVTVEHDVFEVSARRGRNVPTASDRVVAAILGTREGAVEGGHRLRSTGVAWSDQAEAAALRDVLACHKLENVVLVSAFVAAAALAQAFGVAIGYVYTALMFVEKETATLAVVDTADGAIVSVDRQRVRPTDAVAALTETVLGVQATETYPDGVFVVGSEVDVAPIKHQLEAATALPVSVLGEPELALARGAALVSAHAPLVVSSTAAEAYARDRTTGGARPAVVPDHNIVGGAQGLAYSAVPSSAESAVGSGMLDFGTETNRQPDPRLAWVGSALGLFVVGVVTLVISLAIGIRPHVDQRPRTGGNVIAPTKVATAPPQAPVSPPAAPAQPAGPAHPAPAHPAPAPAHPAPAPPPALPPPAPAVPVPVPFPAPIPVPAPPPPAPVPVPVPIPGFPGIPGLPGPHEPKIPGIPHGPKGPGIPGLPGIPGIPGL
jgi:hypothetical protein